MATQYGAGTADGGVVGAPPPTSSPSPIPQQWYEQKQPASTQESSNLRSVTPAMNNTRGAVTNNTRSYPTRGPSPVPASAAGGTGAGTSTYYNRSGTPQRYYGAYNSPTNADQSSSTPQPPSSTGLIRLSLRKPMGIVFEPMYDPHNPSVQRGVRICDLPRTGAAALSRKLEVGDELLSINDKTMSRLTFDEIMDFIIEADPDQVNLLFRRPRKETLAARQAKTTNPNNNTSVKWVDDDHRKKKDKRKSKDSSSKHEKKSASKSRSRKEEDDTVQSTESDRHSPRKRGSRVRSKDPYESESFLDLLIDTICANTDNVCRDRSGADPRRGEDDYYSDEDDDRTSTSADDSTYVTYESEPPKKNEKRRRKGQNRESSYDETEDDTLPSLEEDHKNRKNKREKNSARSSPPKESKEEDVSAPKRSDKPYEDDATLETVETTERAKDVTATAASPPPLGLAPNQENAAPPEADVADAPIAELEYDGRIDHGADVSVMESLGGPSLLIEKQRHAAVAVKGAETTSENAVSRDLVNKFGKDYPAEFGYSREQTIQKEPIKFYTFVVKKLLQEHEPEKVRLLDKLLAKYKGREEHLVRKLSVRYDRSDESGTPTIPEGDEGGFNSFVMDVNKSKESGATAAAVQSAKARLGVFETDEWPPGKSAKDENDDSAHEAKPQEGEESQGSESYTASDFSGDSIDGTSPAVIAQVSELLNYVYGKTSVPGQIDRVSTIMRAYEGREAVLLELLETKALIKANAEKESAANLPSFLRNSPALHQAVDDEENPANPTTSPVSGLTNPNSPTGQPGTGTMIQDDISSMSGVSAPANGQHANGSKAVMDDTLVSTVNTALEESKGGGDVEEAKRNDKSHNDISASKSSRQIGSSAKSTSGDDGSKTPDREKKKKKKGIFGGLFGKKGRKGREPGVSIPTTDVSRSGKKGLMSPKGKKGYSQSTEGSI